jgi:nitrogen regulatory protein PII
VQAPQDNDSGPEIRPLSDEEKLDQRIQLVASASFGKDVDDWRRTQQDLPSRSEAIRRLVYLGLQHDEEHPMRMITAIVRPHRYEAVRDALTKLGVSGITATQVQGFGRQRGQTEMYRGAEYQVAEVPKIRIDVAVPSGMSEAVVDAIQKAAGSGKIGDGKIFVSGLTEVVRIRTGERDEKALD